MSFEKISKLLCGDSPGRTTELNYFRIGPENADKKVYLQAAIHADEQPGILILHHLLKMLQQADEAGHLKACFILFPMVNPLGMGDIEFGKHQGRYNRSSGVNHNREWPGFSAVVEAVTDKLGSDAEANIALVRQALRDQVADMPETTVTDEWRRVLYTQACDADYVFDLHCDEDALLHIYSVPQLESEIHQLARWSGAAATMLVEASDDGYFDEVWPAPWIQLARQFPDYPLPIPVVSCTLEYRGKFDTFDEINQEDALQLFSYFQAEGLIDGEPVSREKEAAPASDFRATATIRAPQSGLLAFRVKPGDRVSKGDVIAELLQLDGDDAFQTRIPILAETSGLLLSRCINKYVWRNANICKIVGSEILSDRSGCFLSD